jgi:hypothetical protein
MLNGHRSTTLRLPVTAATFSHLGAASGRVDRALGAARRAPRCWGARGLGDERDHSPVGLATVRVALPVISI